ncbi:MAG: nicotinate-nucleotide adenylyltransferase [Cyanobacteria bacterium J06623_4]
MTHRNAPLRVALFGTSADPPHLGHQSILMWLSQRFDEVVVWAADNPYKPNQSAICDRAEMLRLLIQTLPQRRLSQSRLSRQNSSQRMNQTIETAPSNVPINVSLNQQLSDRYSIYSIARARKIWPTAEFSFVVGADLLEQLPKWYRASELFAQVDILVFPRPGYSIEGPALSALRQLATVKIAHPSAQYDISSSTYRENRCIHSQQSGSQQSGHQPGASDDHAYQLPPVIRDYIIEHDLYPCLQQTPKATISTRG